jgi:Flp pilus assembly protein TadB
MTPRTETQAKQQQSLGEQQQPLGEQQQPIGEQQQPIADPRFEVAPDLRRRREVAAQVRKRRLLLADVGLGAALALIGLLLAPGLAIVAFGALVVLAGCAGWVATERLARRRVEAGKTGLLEGWRAELSRRLRDRGMSNRRRGRRR